MKKQTMRILGAVLILTILLACLPAAADSNDTGDGWLSITVGSNSSQFDREGIQLGIYLLATGDYGDWTMLDAFKDVEIFTRSDGSTSVNKNLTEIIKRIEKDKIKPTATVKTDKNGVADFKDLAHGIYLLQLVSGPERLKINPMLLSVPDKDGKLQYGAVAKQEYSTPTPSPTPTPKPTPTPFVPDETPTVPTRTPVPPTPTPKPTPTPTPKPTSKPTSSPTPTPEPANGRVPRMTPRPGEEEIPDYETALGIGNIQMHVGVCFD